MLTGNLADLVLFMAIACTPKVRHTMFQRWKQWSD